jgi:hypothetical protein
VHAQHSILLLGFTASNRKKLENFAEKLRKDWNIPSKSFSNMVMCLSGAVSNAASLCEGNSDRVCIFVSARNEGPFIYFEVESNFLGHRTLADTYKLPDPTGQYSGTHIIKCLADMYYFTDEGKSLTMAFIKESGISNSGEMRQGS